MSKLLIIIVLLALGFELAVVHAAVVNNNSSRSAAGMAVPVISSLSRLVGQAGSSAPSSRIQYESYKALYGETVRLECPQPNPTWFFRRHDENGIESVEDLIVTRHGIINADYKYKIMCHVTLKHKVIVINSIEFEDEGLYTCLYTMPSSSGDSFVDNSQPAQYRYVFNVTVFSLINGLTMSYKPLNLRPEPQQALMNKKFPSDQFTELVDNSLLVREHDEFLINCVVDNSKPVADIQFSISSDGPELVKSTEVLSLNSNNKIGSLLTLSPLSGSTKPSFNFPNTIQTLSTASSIVSINTNVVKNPDLTYKTVLSARIRPTRDDHRKFITCKADNGFSSQKWEVKKELNVQFAPICKDPPKFTYYIGINQTLNVECRIQNANPALVTYEWNLDSILPPLTDYSSSILPNNFIKSESILESSVDSFNQDPFMMDKQQLGNNFQNPFGNSFHHPVSPSPKVSPIISDGFSSRFKWRPGSMRDFGEVRCKASNEIGSTECIYEIRLGGVPNPPTDCQFTLKNASAIISCQVGFHQGDPDIYCYLLRKSDNGVYKEHTRNRESCSFIVNDVNVNKLNEFWIYSSNRHGHNKDSGVYLTIGQIAKPVEKSRGMNLIAFGIVGAVAVFIIGFCCFCYRLRKGSEDSDSMYENDPAYQTKTMSTGSLIKKGSQDNFPVKVLKGMKSEGPNDVDQGGLFYKEQKYIKLEMGPSDKSNPYSRSPDQTDSMVKHPYSVVMINGRNSLKKSTSFGSSGKQPAVRADDANSSIASSEHSSNNHDDNNKLLKKEGLLTTVENMQQNKMVTFGSLSNQQANSRKSSHGSNNHAGGGGATLTSQLTTSDNQTLPSITTTTTSASSVSPHSSTSPTASSNLESPHANTTVYTTDDPNECVGLNVSDQSYKTRVNLSESNKLTRLTTFGGAGNNLNKRQPATQSGLLYSNGIQNEFSDSFETKYLNKLCEDVEVSLNVDCECADDYSSNDFSGDYSFDNEPRHHHHNHNHSSRQHSQIYSNRSQAGDLVRKKSIEASTTNSGNYQKLNKISTANLSHSSSCDTSSSSSKASNHLGVLV